ncbi:MAG: hypothetical protein MUQ30_09390, partial [Anaerolineae bacterium]|nr:hypothetical protein [Anaerolineae bacterium]
QRKHHLNLTSIIAPSSFRLIPSPTGHNQLGHDQTKAAGQSSPSRMDWRLRSHVLTLVHSIGAEDIHSSLLTANR